MTVIAMMRSAVPSISFKTMSPVGGSHRLRSDFARICRLLLSEKFLVSASTGSRAVRRSPASTARTSVASRPMPHPLLTQRTGFSFNPSGDSDTGTQSFADEANGTSEGITPMMRYWPNCSGST